MTQPEAQKTLARMLTAKKGADSAPAADKAISAALVRAAAQCAGLEIEIRSLCVRSLSLAELPEVIEDRTLRMMIEGPHEASGLVVLGPGIVSAITQMQTFGRLMRMTPTSRRPTRTDAALSAEFTDAWLAAIDREMVASADRIWAAGFRYASWVDESRSVATFLEDIPYRVWQIDIAAEGRPIGEISWVIPSEGHGTPPVTAIEPGEGEADQAWIEGFQQSVLGSEARLDAILHRMTVPLSAVLAFRAGTDISLPAKAISTMQIEASGLQLFRAKLGQLDGNRAISLESFET